MDSIGKILRQSSMQNLTWMSEGLVDLSQHDLEKGRDNNKKDDLQLAWGYGDIEPHYDADAGEVERNLPEDDSQEKEVIKFARDLMMKGKMGKEISKPLKKRFSKDVLAQSLPELRKLFAWEGLIGCVVVDATDYDNPRDAMKIASNSPYKRFLKVIIGSKAGRQFVAKRPGDKLVVKESSGNSFDDFFGDDSKYSPNMVEICKETHLPIIAGQQDLSDEFMDATLIDLVTTGQLSEEEAKVIGEKEEEPAEKIKAAFRLLRSKELAKKKVDAPNKAKENKVSASKFDLEIDKPVVVENLDVDERAGGLTVEVEPPAPENIDVDERAALLAVEIESAVKELKGVRQRRVNIPVEIQNEVPEAIEEIDLTDHSVPNQVSVDEDMRGDCSALDVDPNGKVEVNIDEEKKSIDVDMLQALDKEFEGSDIIELEAERQYVGECDVDITGSFDF